MYIGYCLDCKYIDLVEENKESVCSRCCGRMLPLNITSNEWNRLTDEEKQKTIDSISSGESVNVVINSPEPDRGDVIEDSFVGTETEHRQNEMENSNLHIDKESVNGTSIRKKIVEMPQTKVDYNPNESAIYSFEARTGLSKGIINVYSDRVSYTTKKEESVFEFSDIQDIKKDMYGNMSILSKDGERLICSSTDMKLKESIIYIRERITPLTLDYTNLLDQGKSKINSENDSPISNLLQKIDFGADSPIQDDEYIDPWTDPCSDDPNNIFVKKVKNLPHADTIFGKRDIKDMKKILQPAEKVKAVCTGWYDGRTWIFACTDRRVLAVNKNLLIGGDQLEIPFSQIHAMAIKRGLLFSDISVQTGVRMHVITDIMNDAAKYFVDCANREIEKRESGESKSKQVINHVNQVAASSEADEIKKFKSLLDEGIISQDEFDAKKKQLLGI